MTDGTLDYLSDDWFARANDALGALPGSEEAVRIAYHVTDTDDRWVLAVDADGVRFEPGADDGEASLSMTYDVAAAVARGEASAQRAVLDGRLRVGGDLRALLRAPAQRTDVADVLADLRAATRFDRS